MCVNEQSRKFVRTHENAYLSICIIRFLLLWKHEIKTKNRKKSYYSRMIILTTSGVQQTFSFIPRSQTYDTLNLTDEQLNTTVAVTIQASTNGDYYDTISAVFVLKEGHFYKLELKNGSTVVHKDRVFCTDQPVATYSVNNGQYTSQASNNEFIIYE